MLIKSRAVAAVTTWALVVLSSPVTSHATDTADADAGDFDGRGGIPEILVSARRRAENAQDVPIPITALTGGSLEEAGQLRLEDLNERLPSLNVQFANPRQSSIAVRGLGNNPANDGLESSVGVYLDDVYLGRPGMANQDLIDLDQVSLLRGPQGTLFGKNTTAGVLNLTSRAPSFTPDGVVETSVGNYGYTQVRGALSGPIDDDTLAGRISYAKTSRDGYIDDVTDGRRLNGVDRQGLRGQLLFKPNNAFSVRVIGDYEEEDSGCCVAVLANLGPNNGALLKSRLAAADATEIYDPNYLSTSINDPQYMDVRQGGGSIQANWRFDNGLNLTSITAYRSWHFLPTNDADGTSASGIINAGQEVHDEQWSEEIRLASPSGTAVDWVTGLYYFYQDQSNETYTLYGPQAHVLYGLPSFYNNAYSEVLEYPKTNSYAVFGQSTWHVTEAWSLTAGLRDTQEDKTSLVERGAAIGAPGIAKALPAYDSGDLQVSNNNVSALLSLGYKFDPNLLGYLSASRGAKAGGINESVPGAGLSASSLYVAPEIANDYELGLKSTLLDQHLLFNVNLFLTDVKDYQATQLEQSTPGVFVQELSNIGGVRTSGVETELTAKPVDWFGFDLNASYNDAVYTSYANAPCSVEATLAGKVTCNLTGQQVVGAPRWVVNPDINVSQPVGGGVSAYGLAGYSWRSSFFGTSDNSKYGIVDEYGLLNLRLGLRGDLGSNKWDFALWANNALDKRYLVGGLAGASFRAYSLYPGAPRFWGATIRVEF
ncbi:MAG: TonB-dependent receptor [Steroidobacteraceae bacterium]|jgi:iron complex outermembrane receptor protein